MRKFKFILLAVNAVLILLMIIPFKMVVARSCVICVVDKNGRPLANTKIVRGWAFGSSEHLEEKRTDASGLAGFDRRIERHSFFGRLLARVHGDARTADEYVVHFPDGYTAAIDGIAPYKWVYEPGHFAKIDLGGLSRFDRYRFKFTIKKNH